jgi:hypothetical protein
MMKEDEKTAQKNLILSKSKQKECCLFKNAFIIKLH